MNTLRYENGIIHVTLEERDTLGDMAMVSGYTMDKLSGMIEEIINQSIYEETNRPRGEWIGDRCSICGAERAWYGNMPDFCPDCGAKMDGERGK